MKCKVPQPHNAPGFSRNKSNNNNNNDNNNNNNITIVIIIIINLKKFGTLLFGI